MEKRYEVVVYGATPGGIGAAIAAARRGRRTLLAEKGKYIGGLMTSGLGRTDIISRDACGAIFSEFADRVQSYYTERYGENSPQAQSCNGGLFFEPSVAGKLLREMLSAEAALTVVMGHELASVDAGDGTLRAIALTAAAEHAGSDEAEAAEDAAESYEIEADVFIDATYEGDLAAMSGVPYRLGRESRDEWNEEYAGRLYMNFDESKEIYPGSTGEGDGRIQAYNYRLCLTDDPANRVQPMQPEQYDRERYASLTGDVRAGRVKSIRDILNMLPIPGGKTDSNNHHYCMCSSDFPEENGNYAEGSRDVRAGIERRHRSYLQGLLWFVQNDEELPQPFRDDARRWGYAADEFADSGHFPPQIYVREARRMWGEYTFTENDARLAPGLGRAPVQYDSVAVGDYPIDSHATRKREPEGKDKALEGFLGLGWITEVYQIPYGVMVPREINGLLVPVAVSATHMGFGTIRMEPCWMQLGFAAGVAADMSIAGKLPLRGLGIDALQDELLAEDQLITYFSDMSGVDGETARACQYFGAKGFFDSYEAAADQPATVREMSRLVALSRSLPGGGRLPVQPASDGILPAGTDMGPRLPMTEPAPAQYWSEQPLLRRTTLRRWLQAAVRAANLELPQPFAAALAESGDTIVTRGELCLWLHRLLRQQRSQRSQTGGAG